MGSVSYVLEVHTASILKTMKIEALCMSGTSAILFTSTECKEAAKRRIHIKTGFLINFLLYLHYRLVTRNNTHARFLTPPLSLFT
jgi:hypothetical protein